MRKSESKKRREQARKNFACMHKVGEYDENGFNCKAFITFINRYGYYVIENMVGDNYLEKYQDEINQLKLIVQNSDETENIFETVTESIEIISKNKTKSNQDSKTKYTIKSDI